MKKVVNSTYKSSTKSILKLFFYARTFKNFIHLKRNTHSPFSMLEDVEVNVIFGGHMAIAIIEYFVTYNYTRNCV